MDERETECPVCGNPVSEKDLKIINNISFHNDCCRVKSEKYNFDDGSIIDVTDDGSGVIWINGEFRFIPFSDLESNRPDKQ